MGSLDLTAAFDVVNIDLLIKRLKNPLSEPKCAPRIKN
jgi:hypothetical protein